MIVGKNKNLEYDAENRLTKVIEPNSVSTFTYDGDGGRVSKTQ
jgi:YD repeat-containing protein